MGEVVVQAQEKPLPEAPVSGLMDGGSLFTGEEQPLMETALRDFETRTGLPLYVVTEASLSGETAEAYTGRLTTEWLKGKPGLLLLFEQSSGGITYGATPGSLGKNGNPKALFLTGIRAASGQSAEATVPQRLRAAVEAMTGAGEVWRTTGKLPDGDPPPQEDTGEGVKPPEGFVVDNAGILEQEDKEALQSALARLSARSGIELYILIFPSLPHGTTRDYAGAAAGSWLKERTGAVMVVNAEAGAPDFLGVAGGVKNGGVFSPESLAATETRAKAYAAELRSSSTPGKAVLGATVVLLNDLAPPTPDPAVAMEKEVKPVRWIFRFLAMGAGVAVLWFGIQTIRQRPRKQQVHAGEPEPEPVPPPIFPPVTVGRRLGAPHGGGVVVGISFGDEPKETGK